MNKEAIEHRNRLKILENTMGTAFYETGHLHLAISDAMEEYHKAKLKLLDIPIVSQQRELLLFRKWQEENWNNVYLYEDKFMVDTYLNKK